MGFEFATATRILFGRGVHRQVASLARQWGRRVFVITGRSAQACAMVISEIKQEGLEAVYHTVHGEPTTSTIQDATVACRGCDVVIACGGGSVIDTGKAVAALVTNGGALIDYLEVIGKGEPLRVPSLPFIAIPTTAGTGAEVTSNAVMESTEHKVKVSLRHPFMFPMAALVDSSLTLDLPPALTAYSGLDALTQVIEPWLSLKANPMTDLFCQEGIKRAGRSLARAYEHGNDEEAREDLALVSLFGGLALSNAKLGAVHGFAGPMGGMFKAGHGALCAILLPRVLKTNLKALREREPGSGSLARFDRMASLLLGKEKATADDGVSFILDLTKAMRIPGLRAYGTERADFPVILEKASKASSMQGNPVRLTMDEMEEILSLSL